AVDGGVELALQVAVRKLHLLRPGKRGRGNEQPRSDNPPCFHHGLPLSHSQAAPRTPLDSPWALRARRVATWSENTVRVQSRGTSVYRRPTFDIPPPSTITSGSSTLITPDSARASLST